MNNTNAEGAQHGVGPLPASWGPGSTGEGPSPTCIPPALVDTAPLPLGTKTSSGDPAPGLCPPVCSLCPSLGLAGAGQSGLQLRCLDSSPAVEPIKASQVTTMTTNKIMKGEDALSEEKERGWEG